MKQTTTHTFFLVTILLLIGCGGGARYVDSTGPETIVSLDQIDIQDWNEAADDLVQELLASGVLDEAKSTPAVLAISRIVNNTSEPVDTNLLTRRIRITLNQSGKALTTTTIGLGGDAEDPLARDQAAYESFRRGGPPDPSVNPEYSLSGRLIETKARARNTRQTTYTFQLALTQISTGLAVWEGDKNITKQGRKNAVSW